MKKANHLISNLFLTAISIFVISLQSFGSVGAAGSAQLSLSPASGSYQNGSTFKITISTNSTEEVNGVQADINYDTSKLQFLNIETASSDYDLGALASGGSGVVKIARAKSVTGLTGKSTVAAVNFKVLVGSGTSNLSFASSSAIVRKSDNQNVWDENTTGGTYSFTTPTTSTPPPAGGSGTPTTTTSSGSTSTPTNTQTPNPSNSSNSSPATNTPDNSATAQETAPAVGYSVSVRILDDAGKPAVFKTVSFRGQTAETDETGIVSFGNVPPGVYEITDGKDGKGKVLASITVVDNPNAPFDIQQFEIKLGPKNKLWSYVIPAVEIIGILVVLVFLRTWYKKQRALRKDFNRHFPKQSSKSVVPKQEVVTAPPNTEIKPNQSTTQTVTPTPTVPQAGKTVLPTDVQSGNPKKPIVWSGDDK